MSREQIPKTYLCPISFELMDDPYIDPDGNSYEKVAISEWLKRSHYSPITRNPMTIENLVPNRGLKDLIDQFKSENSSIAGVVPAPVTPLDRKPILFFAVIDTSGSMGEPCTNSEPGPEDDGFSRLDLVKHTLNTVISALHPDDKICIIKFSTVAEVVVPLTPLTDRNRKVLKEKVKYIEPEQQTNIWDGLRAALDIIAALPPGEDVDAEIFLLTDGVPNINPPRPLLDTVQNYIKKKCINYKPNIHTFGYGYSLLSDMLYELANSCNGYFGFIPDASMVGTVFINTLSSTLTPPSPNLRDNVVINQVIDQFLETLRLLLLKKGPAHNRKTVETFVEYLEARLVEVSGESKPEPGSEITAGVGNAEAEDAVAAAKSSSSSSSAAAAAAGDASASSDSKDGSKFGTAAEGEWDLVNDDAAATAKSEQIDSKDVKEAGTGGGDDGVIGVGGGGALGSLAADSKATGASPLAAGGDSNTATATATAGGIGGRDPRAIQFIEELLLDCRPSDDPNVGQIAKAVRPRFYTTWGPHYLYSVKSAFEHRVCINFKDRAMQTFKSAAFDDEQMRIEDIFLALPPPKPSLLEQIRRTSGYGGPAPIIPTAPAAAANMANYHNTAGGCFTGESLILAVVEAPTVEQLTPRMPLQGVVQVPEPAAAAAVAATGHQSTGKVWISPIAVKDLQAGQKVWSHMGITTVQCVVKLKYTGPLYQVESMNLTAYHPIRRGNMSLFPCECADAIVTTATAGSYVYDVVLENRGIIASPLAAESCSCTTIKYNSKQQDMTEYTGSGIDLVMDATHLNCLYVATFGHCFRDDGGVNSNSTVSTVAAKTCTTTTTCGAAEGAVGIHSSSSNIGDGDIFNHAYFGSEAVVADLQRQPGWESGFVLLEDYCFRRSPIYTPLSCVSASTSTPVLAHFEPRIVGLDVH